MKIFRIQLYLNWDFGLILLIRDLLSWKSMKPLDTKNDVDDFLLVSISGSASE
jgi:hypothetical protein